MRGEDEDKDDEEEGLGAMVFMKGHKWLLDHHALQVLRLLEHLGELSLMGVLACVRNHLDAGLLGPVHCLA